MNTLVKNSFPAFFNEYLNHESNYQKNVPSANIIEEKEAFIVELAAPGFKKEDFKVEITEKRLTISIQKEKEEPQAENQKFIRKEFAADNFSRVFRLPNIVNIEQVEAVYENGILAVSIPKKEEAKPKEPRLLNVN